MIATESVAGTGTATGPGTGTAIVSEIADEIKAGEVPHIDTHGSLVGDAIDREWLMHTVARQ